MGNQLAHFGSSNFPSPVVYGKEQSLAEPTWVQKRQPSVCFWIVRRNIPEKANHKNSYKGSSGIFSPVILQTEESFIPTTSSQQNLTDKITD